MSDPAIEKECLHCGEWTPASLDRCQSCGRRERDRPLEATDFLMPRNVSLWSMLACYIGLVSFVLPIVGGVLAIIFAVIALVKRPRDVTYGSVTSDVRAVFGLIFGLASVALWSVILFSLASK